MESRSSAGSTPLSPNAGGAKSILAAKQGPHRGSSIHAETLNITGCPTPANRKVQAPEPRRSQASTVLLLRRSASHPPVAYPLLIAARLTPISAPHTNSELPNTGASRRLPKISSAITTAPLMNAVANRPNRDQFALFDNDVMRLRCK